MSINLTFADLIFFTAMLKIKEIRRNTYAQLLENYPYVKLVDNYVRINPLRKVIRRDTTDPYDALRYARLKAEWESKLPPSENINKIISQFLTILSKNKVDYNHQPRNRVVSFWDKKKSSHIYLNYFPSGWIKNKNYNSGFEIEIHPIDVFDLIQRLERFRILTFKLIVIKN